MSSTNGIQTLAKSMNGIISISDGSGTVIENGVIQTEGIASNNLVAATPSSTCSLYQNVNPNNIISVGSQVAPTTLNLGEKLKILSNNLDSRSITDSIKIGGNSSVNVDLGNSTGSTFVRYYGLVTGIYDIINNSYLVSYVSGIITNLLSTANSWILTQTFQSGIKTDTIQPYTTNDLISLQTGLKTDTILPYTLNGPIMLGDKTKGLGLSNYYGVRLQGVRNALSYYQATTGQTFPTWIESTTNGSNAHFDFHCNGANDVDFDARIICDTATTGTTTGTATMSLIASAIKMNNILPVTTNGPILLGDKTLVNYGARLQGTKSALSYYQAVGQTNPTWIESICDGSKAYINFHSQGLSNVNYDTQIVSEFGSTGTVDNTGSLGFNASIININPVGIINMGSSTSPTTRVRCTDALVIGNTPSTYSAGLMTAPGLAMRHSTAAASIEFYSNIVNSTNSDSKIISSFGTASPRSGTLDIQSGTVNLSGLIGINLDAPYITSTTPGQFLTLGNSSSIQGSVYSSLYCNGGGTGGCFVNAYPNNILFSATSPNASVINSSLKINANAGIAFNRGIFTGGTMFSGGAYVHPNNLGAGSAVTVTIPFNMTFGAGPIYLTVYTYSTDAASMGVISSFQGTNTTQFTANFYNSRNVFAPGGTFGLNYMAFGNN